MLPAAEELRERALAPCLTGLATEARVALVAVHLLVPSSKEEFWTELPPPIVTPSLAAVTAPPAMSAVAIVPSRMLPLVRVPAAMSALVIEASWIVPAVQPTTELADRLPARMVLAARSAFVIAPSWIVPAVPPTTELAAMFEAAIVPAAMSALVIEASWIVP